MSDEDWGFFIDLEVDPTLKDKTQIKIEPAKIKKSRMAAIYEEEIWYHKEDDTEDEWDKKENEKNPCKNSLISKTSVLIYCVICASFISLSIVLL